MADGGEPAEVRFDVEPPRLPADQLSWLEETRAFYRVNAERFVDLLMEHCPGGFVDAVFGELAYRKACLFRVPHGKDYGKEHGGPF